MHRFASKRTLFKLRLASLFFVLFTLSCLLLPAAIIWGIPFNHPEGIRWSIYLLCGSFGSGLLYLIVSADLRCPLCRGHVLRKLQSSPINSRAKHFLGSRRLAVALSALFGARFRCMHCGEPCDTRNPRHR